MSHSHSHSHPHHDSHSSDLVHHNKHVTNEHAGQFDNRADVMEASRRIGGALKAAYPYDKEKTTVLDFACGTGLVGSYVAPYVKSLLGVDVGEAVVNIFNKRMKDSGYDTSNFKAIAAELNGHEGELDGQKFDVVICSMAYHHFDSIAFKTQMLASFLNPNGVLLVVDMEKFTPGAYDSREHTKEAEQWKKAVNLAHRNGISEQQMKEVIEGAGLKDFELTRFSEAYTGSKDYFFTLPDSDVPPELDEHGNPKGDKFHLFLVKAVKR